MTLRHVLILLGKELSRGPRNFVFIFAIVVPVVLTLVVSLLFGTLFSGKPQLGIVDEGQSRLPALAQEVSSIQVQRFETAESLRDAVSRGQVDLGLVLPAGFDAQVNSGEAGSLTAYLWGESLLRDRAVLGTAVVVLLRDLAGQEPLVEIVMTTIGDGADVPWNERLTPFIVLMTIILGGSMVPATSLVNEKQKHTLRAVTITPASLGEVLLAKGLLGAILSFVMGVVILALNRGFGAQPGLLLLVLGLSAMAAAVFGVLLGAFVKDINTLFATIKAIGILLYAPAFLYFFPDPPRWVEIAAYFFPTYYMIAPIVEIGQNGAGWADLAGEMAVLVGIILLLVGVTAVAVRRAPEQETGLNVA